MSSRTNEFVKDPNEVLDYTIEFDDLLALDSDTIDSIDVNVTAGDVVLDASGNDDTTVTVWVSGGTVPTDCRVTATVTTAGNRVHERSIKIRVRDK
jgi:hypothetical protein